MAEAAALQQRIHPGETMIGVSVSRERTRVQSGGWRTADVTCGSRWKVRTSGSVIDVTAPTLRNTSLDMGVTVLMARPKA